MSENTLSLIALISPAIFIVTAIVSWFQPGLKPLMIKRLSKVSTVISIVIAGICSFFVFQYGLLQTNLIGIDGLGFSLRLDALSMVMLSMITLLGFIIIKFSLNYLDGDQRQGAFIGRMAATIASVQFLVLSGNLGILLVSWILTSISLHRLLVFYRNRPGAQIAARKKFILARLGDASLLIAFGLLYKQFDTGNLQVIFDAIKSSTTTDLQLLSLEAPALFIVLAAVLKSAQFPTHGWLIEVMETPTPVSALLHAGLLNAGPFLIIRMAYVMEASTVAPVILMIVGGLTALIGSVVYLTQTSVKTALGYSSVAHMGFSLMVCGLGVYPAAMLHLVAHSFYKAHSFLSSGSVIDVVRGSKIVKVAGTTNPLKVILGVAMALSLYAIFAMLWGIDLKREASLVVIGAIIVMGLSRIFTSALQTKNSLALLLQASFLALAVTVAFFVLESSTHFLLASQLPALTSPGLAKLVTACLILLIFGGVVFIQIISSRLSYNAFYQSLAIHARNGFYANALFDRLVGALRIHSKESKKVIHYSMSEIPEHEAYEAKELKEQYT